jgi:hypothetical protein
MQRGDTMTATFRRHGRRVLVTPQPRPRMVPACSHLLDGAGSHGYMRGRGVPGGEAGSPANVYNTWAEGANNIHPNKIDAFDGLRRTLLMLNCVAGIESIVVHR